MDQLRGKAECLLLGVQGKREGKNHVDGLGLSNICGGGEDYRRRVGGSTAAISGSSHVTLEVPVRRPHAD